MKKRIDWKRVGRTAGIISYIPLTWLFGYIPCVLLPLEATEINKPVWLIYEPFVIGLAIELLFFGIYLISREAKMAIKITFPKNIFHSIIDFYYHRPEDKK